MGTKWPGGPPSLNSHQGLPDLSHPTAALSRLLHQYWAGLRYRVPTWFSPLESSVTGCQELRKSGLSEGKGQTQNQQFWGESVLGVWKEETKKQPLMLNWCKVLWCLNLRFGCAHLIVNHHIGGKKKNIYIYTQIALFVKVPVMLI